MHTSRGRGPLLLNNLWQMVPKVMKAQRLNGGKCSQLFVCFEFSFKKFRLVEAGTEMMLQCVLSSWFI